MWVWSIMKQAWISTWFLSQLQLEIDPLKWARTLGRSRQKGPRWRLEHDTQVVAIRSSTPLLERMWRVIWDHYHSSNHRQLYVWKSNALIHVPSGNQTWQFMGSPFKLALMISRPSTRIASCVIPGIATSWLQGAPRVSKGPLQPTRDPGQQLAAG